MILPLAPTFVTPNHLTTVRLIVGLACAYAFAVGSPASINVGALLLVISNVIDHADGELARVTGKTSRFGHFYDLAADALVTVLLFVGIGAGVAASSTSSFAAHGTLYGTLAGLSVAAIFYMRMKIEDAAGKAGTKQPSWGGFEMEDILYLMPIVTLLNGLQPFLISAVIGAPLFALWVAADFVRVMRQRPALNASVNASINASVNAGVSAGVPKSSSRS